MDWSFNKEQKLNRTKGSQLIQGDNASCDPLCVLAAVMGLFYPTGRLMWRHRRPKATSFGNTFLLFQLFVAVSFPPCHQSCCFVVYFTCNGIDCPWRTGCCWTPCGPDLTSQAWWNKKKIGKMMLHLNGKNQNELENLNNSPSHSCQNMFLIRSHCWSLSVWNLCFLNLRTKQNTDQIPR